MRSKNVDAVGQESDSEEDERSDNEQEEDNESDDDEHETSENDGRLD